MNRILPDQTILDAVVVMSEGNPGCAVALAETLTLTVEMLPGGEGEFTFLAALFKLDELEIYGTDIYVLFNDKCERKVDKFLMLLNIVGTDILSEQTLINLSQDQNRKIQLSENFWSILEEKYHVE